MSLSHSVGTQLNSVTFELLSYIGYGNVVKHAFISRISRHLFHFPVVVFLQNNKGIMNMFACIFFPSKNSLASN